MFKFLNKLMIREGSKKIGIVASKQDLLKLEYLQEKLGMKPTQIYRLALALYYREERKVED